MSLNPLAPIFRPRPILSSSPPNGCIFLQSINLHLHSIMCEKPSVTDDSFESSTDNIPQTSDEALTPATPTIQQSLPQNSPHHTASTLALLIS